MVSKEQKKRQLKILRKFRKMVFEGKSRMEAYEKLSKEFGLSVGGIRHAIVAAIASEQEAPDGKKEERLGWATIDGYGRGRYGTCPDKDKDLFMTPVCGYMNVYKNETNKVLFGGVVRATLEECIGAGKVPPIENLEWFCHARVELLEEEEGWN